MRKNKSLSWVTATITWTVVIVTTSGWTMWAADGDSLKHLTPKEYAALRDAVVAYAECEECESGELDAVVRFREKAVPTLVAVLERGPSEAKMAEHEFGLRRTYQNLQEYARKHPEGKVSLSEQDYLRTYRDNYKALYQVRAATALAAIGGTNAKKALEQASQRNDLRADVLKDIKKLLRK